MVYDYVCSNCGFKFEAEHSIKDTPKINCPDCGEDAVRRMISDNTNFILKGSGWAKDGYSE